MARQGTTITINISTVKKFNATDNALIPSAKNFVRHALTVLIVFPVLAAIVANAQSTHWVGTWGCSMQLTEPRNNPPPPGLTSNTLRQVVHVTIGGKQLRVRLSNIFGNNAMALKSVHVALNPSTMTTSTIDPATDKALTFHGKPSVVIPAGEDVLSDPFAFDLPPLTNLAIAIYFGATSGHITGHPGSQTTSYILTGDAITATNMNGAVRTDHWYNIANVDVQADSAAGAVVILGDSITDGWGTTTDANERWPDALAFRLHTNAPTANVAVINMGIGGNGIFGGLGPSAKKRFDRDVLDQSGVRWVIIFEGVNDIAGSRGWRNVTIARKLIAAFKQFIAKAHAQHLRVYGATITPFGRSFYDSRAHEAARETVNTWIRTNHLYDGVIDFDAAVRDPAKPTQLRRACDSGDHLHLNPTGYRAMADAIDLSLFAR